MASLSQKQSEIVSRLSDREWRLDNLYYVKNEQGEKVRFRRNPAQLALWHDMHALNVILKARQLGFTTFIQILMLDECLFRPNTAAGVVAHNREDAEAFFTDKIRFAYDNIAEVFREIIPTATSDSVRELRFSNGSSIRVGTSLRSGTLQLLHVSEYGKLCAKYPEKAREVKTGALNTVHVGNMIWIESTAEGREGHFYELCQQAKAKSEKGSALSALDFKFHFFPWWRDPRYSIDPEGVVIPQDIKEALDKVLADLTPGQRAWYAKKAELQGDDIKREYPSTEGEAFEAAIEGAYYAKQMSLARKEKRITRVPYTPGVKVNTFWDLGFNDSMTLWLHQRIGKENRFIGYYENSGEGIEHYASWLDRWAKERDASFDTHYMPHDADRSEIGSGKTVKVQAMESGLRPIKVNPRTSSIVDDIEVCRRVLSSCYFDEEATAAGIAHLEQYRKEWDDNLGVWKNRPRHDQASHGADGFRTFAMGFVPAPTVTFKQPSTKWIV
jgi:hypothetical protein